MLDEGSQFRKLHADLAALHNFNIDKSSVKARNSLVIKERYHKPLRDNYRKLKLNYPSMQRQILLVRVVKSINDTLGPEGIDPSALAFGEFPGLRSLRGPAVTGPSLAEREEAAQQARHCMSQHVAKVKFKRAVHHSTTLATDRVCQRGNEVLLWREKRIESRIGEWIGPYSVVTTYSRAKIVFTQKEADSAQGRFNITQVEPFLRPENEAVAFIKIFERAFCNYATRSTSFSYPHTPLEEYRRSRRDNEIEALECGANTASFVTSPT